MVLKTCPPFRVVYQNLYMYMYVCIILPGFELRHIFRWRKSMSIFSHASFSGARRGVVGTEPRTPEGRKPPVAGVLK